jgi:hypothetical protein
MGQFFLKSKSGIKIGDTISISISLKNKSELEGNIKKLDSYINWKKWVVKYKKDTERPTWRSTEIKSQLFNYGTGLAVELDPYNSSISDNLYSELIKVKDYEWIPYYFLIEFMNERFISSGDHTSPRLFNGTCNGNFTFELNKSYAAKLRAVDASGNFSKETKILNFNTILGKAKPINTDGPYTSIPDPNFEKALIEKGYDSGAIDGKVPTANIANVTYLEVHYRKISDLTGIQDFVALKTLICISNNLTTLDLSQNTALTKLWCFSNQLSSLNVSKNKTLDELHCYENKLTSLDVSQNIALNKLWCFSNLLTTLDVSKNKILKELVCHTNQLTVLDVTKNKTLEELHCGLNKFKTLDVSKNKVLKEFSCYSNQLTFLDVRKNKTLEKFYCQENQLTVLNVNKNMALNDLNCSDNPLQVLDVKKNIALIWLNCHSNQLTNLDVSANTALTWLSCRSNQLTSIDVSKNTALTEFYCFENQLTDFDVSKNTALQILKCNSNKITTLDISKNIALKTFNCSSNQLSALDFSTNTALTELNCSKNHLVSLNLKDCISLKLEKFSAKENQELKCILADFDGSNDKREDIAKFRTSCQ